MRFRSKISILLCFSVMAIFLMPVTVSAGNSIASSKTLKIDGFFDDWANIPHGVLTWNSWNGKCDHDAAIFVEDGYLYGHIKMNNLYGTQIRINSMYIKVNDQKTVQFSGLGKTKDNSIDWSVDVYNLPFGLSKKLGVFNDNYPKDYLGEAALKIYNKNHAQGDEYEFRISLATLSKITGIPEEAMSQFTLSAPNIGGGDISTSGSSTGAFMGITLCITGTGAVLFYKKRKQVIE